MNAVELSELRRTTKTLILTDPTLVAIVKHGDPVRTPAGGVVASQGAPVALLAKKRYFAPTSGDQRLEVTWQGRKVTANFILIGTRDDDEIQEGRTFAVDGVDYLIVYVNNDRRWQTKGYVIING